MGFEKRMEDAIISDPQKYIDEKGLKIIARQYHIGKYIFDLLFEDRHGGKLLVELQDGTLDRNHTYKILDYYYEYKNAHPGEFIDLMVIANNIPPERKKRLADLGIAFKEIQKSEFSQEPIINSSLMVVEKAPAPKVPDGRPKDSDVNKKQINLDKLKSIELFISQAEKFKEAMLDYDQNIKFTGFSANKKNPFVWFWPKMWEISPGQLSGVFIAFGYFYERQAQKAFVRLNVGVEKPIAEEYKRRFKDEVIAVLRELKMDLQEFDLWPNAGVSSEKTKLLEVKMPLNENSWKTGVEYYKKIEGFRSVVANKVEEFKKKGYTI
jgi:hypothetical protein